MVNFLWAMTRCRLLVLPMKYLGDGIIGGPSVFTLIPFRGGGAFNNSIRGRLLVRNEGERSYRKGTRGSQEV